MGLLLLDRAQLALQTEGETLVCYEAGQRRGTVPVKLIDRCVIHGSQTQFDTGVLLKLAEAGATTLIFSPRYPRRTALVLGPQHNDAAVRLAQSRRVFDDIWCQNWASQLVRAKVTRQMRVLRAWQAARPDARKPLFDALATLRDIAQRLNEPNALDLAALRGHEGAAARAYFGGLSAVMPPALRFTGRNRRPPRDPVNTCLSLGYTLLNGLAIQACATVGLDPLLGFYHRPAFGRESLACDLIEPLRPAIDLNVWQLLRQRELREEHFTHSGTACLLGKAGRSIFYQNWNTVHKPWQRWLRRQAQALAHTLRQEGEPWLAHPDEDDEPC